MRLTLLVAALLAFVAAPTNAQQADPATTIEVPAHLQSWTDDYREYAVGEIVTILISERTVASDAGDAQNGSQRSTSLQGGADLGSLVTLPVQALSAGGSYDRSETSTDEIRRRDQFVGEIAVRIVEVMPDGVLRVEGEREVKIDNRNRTLKVSGLIRADDITPRGYVHSTRVADAKIEYKGGPSKMRGGWLGRFLGWIWPF